MTQVARDRNLAVRAYKQKLASAMQSGSRLSKHVTWQSGIEAESYRFPVDGIADVTNKASGADVLPVDIQTARPTAYLESKYSTSYLDPQDTRLSNVDFMRSRADKHAKAMKRAWDAEILRVIRNWYSDAYTRPDLEAPTATGVTANTDENKLDFAVPTAGQLDGKALAKARAMLVNEDMDEDADEICLIYPALDFENMATDNLLASMDYAEQGHGQDNVSRMGRFKKLYGMVPVGIPLQGGRKQQMAGLEKEAWVFAKSAAGMAEGTNKNMAIYDWSTDKQSWLIGARDNFGGCRIQNAGFVRIRIRA